MTRKPSGSKMPATLVIFNQLLGMAITSNLLRAWLQVTLPSDDSWMHTMVSFLPPLPSSFSPPECMIFLSFLVDTDMDFTPCFVFQGP